MADLKHISRFLSLVLRHDPGSVGLGLDAAGWLEVDALIAAAPMPLSVDLIAEIVETSDKQRFALSADGKRIRANQGHSVPVDLGLSPVRAPDTLFHGTAERNRDAILAEGLTRQGRLHVHLSPDRDTAHKVGQRHGKPVIFLVQSRAMQADGLELYRSANGVWLVDHVPAQYLTQA